MSVVLLQQAKDHLQMTTGTNDAELQRFIDTAEGRLTQEVGPLGPTAVVERHDGGSDELVLRRFPVVSLTSVTYADGRSAELTDLELDPETGSVHWRYGVYGLFPGGSRFITVEYDAGYSPLPAPLVQAVLEMVRHLWTTQRGSGARAGGVRGAMTPEGADTIVMGTAYSLPDRVNELISPYRVPRVR